MIEFSTRPVKSENKTANATLGFGYSGSARNTAETFARIGGNRARLFSMVGNDTLGTIMK